MGLKEQVYRGERPPPTDRVFEVERWFTPSAFLTPVGAQDGVTEGDTGWIPVEASQVDAESVSREYLYIRVHDVGETKASAEVRDPAVYDLYETRPVSLVTRLRRLYDRVTPGSRFDD